MPKYTKSKDGVERCTVNVPFRLTREEYESLQKVAASNLAGAGSLRRILYQKGRNYVDWELRNTLKELSETERCGD